MVFVRMLSWNAVLLLAGLITLVGCQTQPPETQTATQSTESTLQQAPAQSSTLTIASATAAAPNPSTAVSGGAASTGSTLQVQAATDSWLTEKPATASDPQIQQTLSSLDARQNSQGEIVIALPGDVLFDFDKSTIRSDARPVLAQIDRLLLYYGKSPVSIEGHTDAVGGNAYNQKLSEQRALAVQNYLISQFQIDAQRLKTQGFGKTRPVAANTKPDGSDNPQGRQLNRRVEVKIQNPAQ